MELHCFGAPFKLQQMLPTAKIDFLWVLLLQFGPHCSFLFVPSIDIVMLNLESRHIHKRKTSVTTHFKKLTIGKNAFIVSVII